MHQERSATQKNTSMNLNRFIDQYVTKRDQSMFAQDIEKNRAQLEKNIYRKSILVIGGAGTIGSSYIKAILEFQPASLVVVDINENGLTELTRDLRSSGGYVPEDYITYPMNYADAVFEKMLRSRGGFDIVANFSAHKHVRSEKDIFSVQALLENNVLRARHLLELLTQFPPQRFFCVSTDKAANPVNIMGGSKKIMEDMIMAYSDKFTITTARFANVAFSNGSLPAGFVERVAKLQPISAPSDVTRYFVSPQESGQICMLACMLGNSRDVYFPKLGKEQVMTFSDMATQFLENSGYQICKCSSEAEAIQRATELTQGAKQYPVYYSGSDTTGEKPYEEFYTDSETIDMVRHHALGVVTSTRPRPVAEIDDLFAQLSTAFSKPDTKKEQVVDIMRTFLKNFDHTETGKYLDKKM